ncbi:MAG: ATP-binding protein [Bacillota bacterium]
MLRVIPKNSKYRNNFFKFLSLLDILIIAVGLIVVAGLSLSNIEIKWYLVAGLIVLIILSLTQVDGDRIYQITFGYLLHLVSKKTFTKEKEDMKIMQSVQKIQDDTLYYEKMCSKIIEIKPIPFALKNEEEQDSIIYKMSMCFAALADIEHSEIHIIKLNRAISYGEIIYENNVSKVEVLTQYYKSGQMTKDEYDKRMFILMKNGEMYEELESGGLQAEHFYLQIIADYKTQAEEIARQISLEIGKLDIRSKILNNEELGIFVKNAWTPFLNEEDLYSNEKHDFLHDGYTKEQVYEYLMPSNINIKFNRAIVDDVITSHIAVADYPIEVGNAWGYNLFHLPNSRVTMKIKLRPRDRAMKDIDKSIRGLKLRFMQEQDESVKMGIEIHINSLKESLKQLQLGNDHLYDVSLGATIYETDMKMAGRRAAKKAINNDNFRTSYNYGETSKWMIANNLTRQTIGHSIGIPATTLAAVFPFISYSINDPKGIVIGQSNGEPCVLDMFYRDNQTRLNGNAFIIGQSGSGKSFASKLMLAKYATSNIKTIIFDPEREYAKFARNMGGVSIDVSNANGGRINPFEVTQELEEEEEEYRISMFYPHLQFLESFFRVVLPKLPDDVFEQLNSLIIETYAQKNIDENTDFMSLKSEDYPIFDDLYELIESKILQSKYEFELPPLRLLLNYISKFSHQGRYANLWNGYTTMQIDSNFINFDFRSMLITENKTLANAQMLLILRFCNLEVIKNKELNEKFGIERKIILFIDEAHVYFDKEMIAALNFFAQMARRIRKYYGNIMFTTQNIGDFISSSDVADKTKAIINACQYSFIFKLPANALNDVIELYKSTKPLNENEVNFISKAERGHMFSIISPQQRVAVEIEAPNYLREIFGEKPTTEVKSEQKILAENEIPKQLSA